MSRDKRRDAARSRDALPERQSSALAVPLPAWRCLNCMMNPLGFIGLVLEADTQSAHSAARRYVCTVQRARSTVFCGRGGRGGVIHDESVHEESMHEESVRDESSACAPPMR
jgi:hypothetical protein